ncbi:MAG: CDP-alcohol phosphatidyltransferase family protein [Spirochaetales bacterium]|nr:CDP-alcohol phosphatidyltransferase family protein [Spirochaetales bacterium]
MRRHPADALSLSRLFLIVPWILSHLAGSLWALPVMAAIILTDIVDGPVARKTGTACPQGALLDASCDTMVLFTASVAAGLSETRYLGLAVLMVLSFSSWAGYSYITQGQTYTRLGRYNGTLGYILLVIISIESWPTVFMTDIKFMAEGIIWNVAVVMLALSTGENITAICRHRGFRTYLGKGI